MQYLCQLWASRGIGTNIFLFFASRLKMKSFRASATAPGKVSKKRKTPRLTKSSLGWLERNN